MGFEMSFEMGCARNGVEGGSGNGQRLCGPRVRSPEEAGRGHGHGGRGRGAERTGCGTAREFKRGRFWGFQLFCGNTRVALALARGGEMKFHHSDLNSAPLFWE